MLPSLIFSEVVRLKLRLRHVSLRTFFLNGVRFHQRESGDIYISSIHTCMDDLCIEDGQRVYDKKIV